MFKPESGSFSDAHVGWINYFQVPMASMLPFGSGRSHKKEYFNRL